MRFLCVIIAAAAFALLTPQLARASSAAGCNGFDGTWRTVWGQSATKVRISGTHGTYDYLDGTLRGSISYGAYYGTYRESNGENGTFKFVLSNDGDTFKGWYATSAAPDQHMSWRGVCIGP